MKIIINIATHGDEKIGNKVAKELKKLNIDKNLIIQIANKKAFELNKRYIEQDLNRSFPGKKRGNYEERRAYKLLPTIKSADLVIDIHSTTGESKDALIITKLNKKTLEYIKSIHPRYVLIMNATKSNALISQAKVGIAFEYGKDNDSKSIKRTTIGIKKLLNHLKIIEFKSNKIKTPIKYFDVFSTIEKPKGFKTINKIKNYKLIKRGEAYAISKSKELIAEENFYPILFDEKKYKDILGFKGRKIQNL